MVLRWRRFGSLNMARRVSFKLDSSSIAVLFAIVSLIIFTITRTVEIDKFPIYFFCDEAFHQIYAQALLDNGFRDSRGVLLPLYIEKASNRWVPQITLYLYMLPVLIWGKSVVLTRLVTAISVS